MKKFFLGILALAIVASIPTMARTEVNVTITMPPPVAFSAPPKLIVLPETYVYAIPDADEDIFFYDGWWWRQWKGRWYRSQNYNSGWGYYKSVPSFYTVIPSRWRDDYKNHSWKGHKWNYQWIPHEEVQQNWKGWEKNKHWEKEQTWGVQGLRSEDNEQENSQQQQGTNGRGKSEKKDKK